MKIKSDSDVRSVAIAAGLLCLVQFPQRRDTPQYQIYDIGVIEAGDTASQG